MSSTLLLKGAEPAVWVGVVGHLVVPAALEDPGPCLGQDPRCTRVTTASVSCPSVGVVGPGVGAWGVLRAVDERGSEVLVAAAAVGDVEVLARLSG